MTSHQALGGNSYWFNFKGYLKFDGFNSANQFVAYLIILPENILAWILYIVSFMSGHFYI